MKLGQLIEYNKRNFFFKNHTENKTGRLIPDLFLFFKRALYKIKASHLQLSFNIFRQFSACDTIKKSCLKLYIIDPEVCSIFIFQKRLQEQILRNILRIIFQEKRFSCYVLLTSQMLWFDSHYFLRYWAICVLQMFVKQAMTSKILKLILSF